MDELQNKKNIINNGKYALAAVIFILIIGGIILIYLWNKEKNAVIVPPNTSTPVLSVSLSPTSTLTPTITPPQEVWQTFTNSELGFTIKYPQMVYGINRCTLNDPFWVPLKVFEDKKNGAAYISEEYYYDNWSDKLQSNTGPCEKITYSLESLLKEEKDAAFDDGTHYSGWKPFLGWKILINTIKNDTELNKFIKDNYGSGCLVESKTSLEGKNGIYNIEIKGKDWAKGADLGQTTCPINYEYKVLYAPEKKELMSVKLGQECTFGTNPSSPSYKCYDEEMINSFNFK